MTSPQLCPCGKPLHYSDPSAQALVESMVATLGATVRVTVEDSTYQVPRHYIALHGLKASELPALAQQYGFKKESNQ